MAHPQDVDGENLQIWRVAANILRVFEKRVHRRTFGSRDEVTRGWRKLHNKELHNFLLLTKY
jgi:hypothetical protein